MCCFVLIVCEKSGLKRGSKCGLLTTRLRSSSEPPGFRDTTDRTPTRQTGGRRQRLSLPRPQGKGNRHRREETSRRKPPSRYRTRSLSIRPRRGPQRRRAVCRPYTGRRSGVRAAVRRTAEAAADRIGDEDFRDVSSHDLRRRFAQRLLVDEGVNPRVIMTIGGWSSFSAIEPYLNEQTEGMISDALGDVVFGL